MIHNCERMCGNIGINHPFDQQVNTPADFSRLIDFNERKWLPSSEKEREGELKDPKKLYSRADPQNTNLETLFRLKKRRQAYEVKAKWKMTTNAEEK